MKTYKAILWDCDGVLIDSEYIACHASASYLTGLGYVISTENYIERFMGKGRFQIIAEVKEDCGRDFSEDFINGKAKANQRAMFEAHLTATADMHDVLAAIDLPMAVASGSDMERLEHTLGLTNLWDVFNGHVYSSEMVKAGKPAPDVFLHAAAKLGIAPEDCLVVEDGIHGIHAAKAAGMDVIAYIGGTHMTEDLKAKVIALQPNVVITQMTELLPLLGLVRKAA